MGNSQEGKLGFGVISASGMAVEHMKAVKFNRDAELKAICDIDVNKAKTVAENLGVEAYYADYRKLLKREDIGAVVIVTPDQIHPEQTIAALEAGKHVLCEKPMALTVAECMEMIKASERTGKKLMIGQICRYTPGFKLAKQLIDDGEIGELFFVESEYAHDYSNITGAGNWRMDPVRLRPPFLGGGCHAVDLLRWVAGDPYEVTAYSNRKVLKSWPVDDCTIAILRFPKDVIGKVFVSAGCKREYTMRSVFYGDRGTIIVDNTTPHLTLYKKSIAEKERLFDVVEDQTMALSYPVALSSHNAIREINVFIDIGLEDKPVTPDGRQGAATVAACLAAVESAGKGEKVLIRY